MAIPKQPNLLLIMCDQLRADALKCYGNPFVHTPNIDSLARRGVSFRRTYSQTPVCMPARHGLISGLHPFQLGLVENRPSVGDINNPLPELLRKQGYATFAVGKMHFLPPRRHYGFDRMLLSEEIPNHFYDDDFLQFLQAQGYGSVTEPHGMRSDTYYVPQTSPLPESHHTTSWTGERTCQLIRQNQNRPFFIFTSFIKPHPPFDPCEPYNTMYDATQIPLPIRSEHERTPDDFVIDVQNDYKVNGIDNISPAQEAAIRRAYYGCVSQIDTQIGHILQTLDDCQLTQDTLIVFTADHGEMLGDHYSYGKRTFYEASARVPLILSRPGSLPEGEERHQLTILQDIYATLLTAGGVPVPEESCGRELLSAIADQDSPVHREVYGEIGRGPEAKLMIRWGDWKYVYHLNGGVEVLFNLSTDPNEVTNIAIEHPQLCQDARRRMVHHYLSYAFADVLQGDELKQLPRVRHTPKGYLDQRPRWPATVVPESRD